MSKEASKIFEKWVYGNDFKEVIFKYPEGESVLHIEEMLEAMQAYADEVISKAIEKSELVYEKDKSKLTELLRYAWLEGRTNGLQNNGKSFSEFLELKEVSEAINHRDYKAKKR